MYRVVSVVVLVVLLMGSVGAMAVDSPQEVAAQQRTSFWCRILPWTCVEPGPTPTPEPAATATPEPTATAVPPTSTPEPDPTATSEPEPTATNTPEPTATSEPGACSVPEGADVWHPPTTHEHGDAPPAWADDWSCDQFGHPVIFGGDEQTPNENAMKHEAYKGVRIQEQGFDVYLRYHAQSNPMGRMAQFHSYEVYARDLSGNVSFWQGWLDFGSSPELRFSHQRDGSAGFGHGGQIVGNERYGRRPRLEDEHWYTRASAAEWSWQVGIVINDPTTWMTEDEPFGDVHNIESWDTTGYMGLNRRFYLRWVSEGGIRPSLVERNMENPRGWFCAAPTGEILQLGATAPDGCADGLPQYIAPTMTDIPGTSNSLNTLNRTMSVQCPGCTLPN